MDSDRLAPWLFAVGLTILVLAELFFLVKVSTPLFEFFVPVRGLVLTLSQDTTDCVKYKNHSVYRIKQIFEDFVSSNLIHSAEHLSLFTL